MEEQYQEAFTQFARSEMMFQARIQELEEQLRMRERGEAGMNAHMMAWRRSCMWSELRIPDCRPR